MVLKLVVTTSAEGDTLELTLKDEVHRVGRRHDNDLRIKESYVSGYHSELRRDADGGYRLVDLDSSNGTFLNGRKVEEPEEIRAGDFIKFGILKVAVKEHAANGGPPILPLSERSAFAKKREGVTPSVPVAHAATGPLAGASTVSGTAASVASVPADSAAEGSERFVADEHALRGELAESQAKAAEIEERFEKLLGDLRAKSSIVAELEARLDEATRHHGTLQSELQYERAETRLLQEQLETGRRKTDELRGEIGSLGNSLARKEAELLEKDSERSRQENEEILRLKLELGDAASALKEAEERASSQSRERLSLSGAFERLKEQWDAAQCTLAESRSREEALAHDKELLTRRLEKAEAGNRELAARIKEDAAAAMADREVISKLELQLQVNESEAARREQEALSRLEGELRHLKSVGRDQEKRSSRLADDLEAAARREAEAATKARDLREELVRREAEIAKERELLRETERRHAQLASELPEASSLAAERARRIEELQREAAEAAKRHEESETSLLARHREQIEELLVELQRERDSVKSLQARLGNTRAGLSEALRCAREKAERELEHFAAESNAKLSKMDEALSESIRRGEAAEEARLALEDALNEREGRIERLAEQVEDLEIKLEEEVEARSLLGRQFLLAREGLSSALAASRRRHGDAAGELRASGAERDDLVGQLALLRESLNALHAESAAERERHASEIAEMEKRYESLLNEKLTLDSESADLLLVRSLVEETRMQQDALEEEHGRLSRELLEEKGQHAEILSQKEALVAEREGLRASLKQGREELESAQRRCSQLQAREEALAEAVRSAERRIESLKELESQMEGAVQRKRKESVVSRSGTFLPATDGASSRREAPGFSREDFYRKLITRIDLIDDLAKRYESRWRFPRVADQLVLVKSSFLELLSDHEVLQFQPDPGTVLSLEERKRIKLVPPNEAPGVRLPSIRGSGSHGGKGENGGGGKARRSLVVQTLRPGYIDHSEGRAVILRKAEVVVA